MTKEDKITELLSRENSVVIWKLYHVFAIPILALYFNDEDLADCKDDFFELGTRGFKKVIMTGNFTSLNNFFQRAFKTKEERKVFKRKINFYPDLVYEGEFKLADEFLDWFADSDEEKAGIKMEPAQIFGHFLDNFEFDLADKFLSWMFSTDEEKLNFRSDFISAEFLSLKIIKIWTRQPFDLEINKNDCTKLLKFLSESDEVTHLKQKLIIDVDFVEKFFFHVSEIKVFETTDDLLKFCLASPEKIELIKENFKSNIHNFISFFIVNQRNFGLSNALVDWIYSDKLKKKEFLTAYVNSSNGIKLLIEVYKLCRRNYVEPILTILNNWVRAYGNADAMKRELASIQPENQNERDAVKVFVNILNRMKAGQSLTENIIINFMPKLQ